MKTLAHANDKQKILRRLRSLPSSTQRRWGKMSAHQMICHLSDAYRMFMNEKTVRPEPPGLPRAVLKFVALWASIPWPKGFKTVPELDREGAGTTPAAFDADLHELCQLIDRVTRQPRDFQWQAHSHFGPLSEKEWMRLGYLHPDHHLR